MRFCILLIFILFYAQQTKPPVPSTQPGVEKRDTQEKTSKPHYDEPETTAASTCAGCSVEINPEPRTSENHSYDARNDTLYRAYLAATILGAAGAIFGIGLLFRQTKATEEAVRISASNFRVQQRAWLSASIRVVERTPDLLKYRIHSKNTGATPALNIQIGIGYMLQNRDYVLELDFSESNTMRIPPNRPVSRNFVAPNDEVKSPIYTLGLTIDNKGAKIERESWLFIGGTITYEDIFGEVHKTDICARLEGMDMIWANVHNDMT
jgi:hypothetical protein